MKRSIRKEMAMIFIGVMTGVLVLTWLVNAFFLESYYIAEKQQQVIEAYETLNQGAREEQFMEEDFLTQLNNIAFTDNLSMLVIDTSGKVQLYTVRDFRTLKNILYSYIFETDNEADDIQELSVNNRYVIRQRIDQFSKAEYIEMLGTLDNGFSFVLQTAVESIRDSVAVSNQFYTYIGIGAVLVSCLLIWLFTKRFTEPILELAEISKRMTDLDFNAKFSGSQNNEIGFLGAHMNQMSEKLEQTISVLKTVNNELERDIEQKNQIDEMRKEFLSNVSHELKTPIALIQGYAEGLKECINDDAESRDFYCEVIMDEASKMNTMVKKLLALNQIEFGNHMVTMERFDIAALIRNVLSSTGILMEQKGIQVHFHVQEPVYVWSDEFQIEEVVTNYVSNAVNHCAGEKIIDIRLEQQEETVRVSVFNTGNPIPEEELDKVWIKFYKIDKARTREYGGSGIGLSIVKAIMDSINRECGVKNYSNGVEFWFEVDSKA
ncbi:MAG: HAMP domain-containing protein [Lachnospiraceae bacterium]|nr:HAMP domain-containing protein [Lachnospiraceae bacterium]